MGPEIMKKIILSAVILTSSLLAGCATQKPIPEKARFLANLDESKIKTFIIKGKTTQEEIRERFGDPRSSDVVDSDSIKYVYTAVQSTQEENYVPFITHPKYNNKIVKLTILFKDKIVSNYVLNTQNRISRLQLDTLLN